MKNSENKILVVDDSPDIYKMVGEVLSDKNNGEIIPDPIPEIKTPEVSGLTCMVTGCTKSAQFGNTQVALCEDHLHLAFKPKTFVRQFPKIGRNEKCFCGSNKKFKKCCGK